ncbi:crotonase/enoyl-CoA hydratase family protein [Rhodococcus sp. 114MFTsu3.1]|uniref:crotonase/enoyl-CoA hydratase family protein n=1 Tax=Rhodococcus sp. 114MFTsu3.1 TaxID=1172184 RepID=UPI0009DBDE84|nr:crotonase/enoyl-CoA hydratase family protein [Rhodococcus sp. 114MFTsu3.1]
MTTVPELSDSPREPSRERVSVDIDAQGVAVVRMTRPDRHNALDASMISALSFAAARISDDSAVRAVVLFGEGKSFCAGLDVDHYLRNPSRINDLFTVDDQSIANRAQRVSYDWQRCPVPVIAAVAGNCLGGGLQLALGADIRIASPEAQLSVMEIRWGLVPDMGITYTLPKLVGIDVAKELTFTGKVVSGNDARRLGLVTRIADDPISAAIDTALDIATRDPRAIRAAKQLLNEGWNTPPRDGFALESRLQQRLLSGGTPGSHSCT